MKEATITIPYMTAVALKSQRNNDFIIFRESDHI